jgi:hypothetical protein
VQAVSLIHFPSPYRLQRLFLFGSDFRTEDHSPLKVILQSQLDFTVVSGG